MCAFDYFESNKHSNGAHGGFLKIAHETEQSKCESAPMT